MRGRTNIINDTKSSSGSDIDIKGNIETYEVTEGKIVESGDFIEGKIVENYIDNYNFNLFQNTFRKYSCQIDITKQLIIYQNGSSSDSQYQISIFELKNNSLQEINTILIGNWDKVYQPIKISNKIYCFGAIKNVGTNIIRCIPYFIVVFLDNNIISYKTLELINNLGGGSDAVENLIVFPFSSTNKVGMIFEYDPNSTRIDYSIYEYIFSISVTDGEINITKDIDGNHEEIGILEYNSITTQLINDEKIIFRAYTNPTNKTTFNNITIFANGSISFKEDTRIEVSSSPYFISLNSQDGILFSSDKTIRNIEYSNLLSISENELDIMDCNIKSFYNIKENTLIIMGKKYSYSSNFYIQSLEYIPVSNKYVLSEKREININTVVYSKEQGNYINLGENIFLLFTEKGYYCIYYNNGELVNGMPIEPTLTVQKHYQNSDNTIIGIAKTGGSNGDTIEVYIPYTNSN